MSAIKSPQDIKKLGSILSVWAHPDDETFACAGIMAMAVANGQNVACITATKGEAGVQDESRWPAAKLADIRARELLQALQIIGIHHHHWLDYRDGCCHQADKNYAARQIAEYIDLYKPDTILSFGPDGLTGHSDHQTVSEWVELAVKHSKHKPTIYHAVQERSLYDNYLKDLDDEFDIFFDIDEPPLREAQECDMCIQLPDEICRKKCQALAAMPSQTEGIVKHLGDDMAKVFSTEAFIKAK